MSGLKKLKLEEKGRKESMIITGFANIEDPPKNIKIAQN